MKNCILKFISYVPIKNWIIKNWILIVLFIFITGNIIKTVPLALLILLIILAWFHNIEYQTAIFIAIMVASIYRIFSNIILDDSFITYIFKINYSNNLKILSILEILNTLIIPASIIFFYLQYYTYAYYLCLSQCVISAIYAVNTMRYKEFRIGSYITFGLNVIVLILGFIFIKHAEIILVVYYILNYLIFVKKVKNNSII